MWGNFVPDLGKLGEQLTAVANEALQKATADVEKSIDSTLGIKGGPGSKTNTATSIQEHAANAKGHSTPLASSDAAVLCDSPSAKQGQKKVVKKVVRRVVKGTSEATTASGTANAAAVTSTAPDCSSTATHQPPSLSEAPSPSPADSDALAKGASTQLLPTVPSHVAHTEDAKIRVLESAAPPTSTDGASASPPAPSWSSSARHPHKLPEGKHDAAAAPSPFIPPPLQGLPHEHPEGPALSPRPNGQFEHLDGAPSVASTRLSSESGRFPDDVGQTIRTGVVVPSDAWDAWAEEDAALTELTAPGRDASRDGSCLGALDAPAGYASEASLPGSAVPTLPVSYSHHDYMAGDVSLIARPSTESANGHPEMAYSTHAAASVEVDLAGTEQQKGGIGWERRGSKGPRSVVARGRAALSSSGASQASLAAGEGADPAATVDAAGVLAPAPDRDSDSREVAVSALAQTSGTPGGSLQHTSEEAASAQAVLAAAAAAVAAKAAEELHQQQQLHQEREDELRRQVVRLQEELAQRDVQLRSQSGHMADLQQVVSGLQARNEQLALQSAAISEADHDAMRSEFEQRLAAAERKVYALSKERDALRKGAEKLADYGALIKEKDDIIKQVMEEGEKLSKKQVELEGIIKRLRGQLGTVEGERDKLTSRLAAEEATAAELRRTKAKLEKDLVVAGEQAKADLDGQRERYELMMQKAKTDQAEAEERARDVAAQGLARKLRESEARCEALAESCAELRDALDRQRQAADLREEMLKADLSDLERRCQAAELRHQDLAAKMPEATRPLLRQIEAMKATLDAQTEAWAGAEAGLHERIEDAEGRAAAAAERERLAVDRMQILSTRVSGLEASLAAARNEVRCLNEQLTEAQTGASGAREAAAAVTHQLELLEERCRVQERQLEQLEGSLREHREAERALRTATEQDMATLRREYERRLAEADMELMSLRARVQAEAMMRSPEPPAMAAPGYRWVLLKEGEQPSGGGDTHSDLLSGSRGTAPGSTSSPDLLASLRAASSGGAPGSSHTSGHGGLNGHPPSGGGGSGDSVHPVMAAELESLRAALRAKTGELAAAQQQVSELEATRDRLAEELVLGATRTEVAAEALQQRDALQAEIATLRGRLSSALELVGERDEQVEELLADLQDVKCMYKDQIEFMCQQLVELQGANMAPGRGTESGQGQVQGHVMGLGPLGEGPQSRVHRHEGHGGLGGLGRGGLVGARQLSHETSAAAPNGAGAPL